MDFLPSRGLRQLLESEVDGFGWTRVILGFPGQGFRVYRVLKVHRVQAFRASLVCRLEEWSEHGMKEFDWQDLSP